MPDELGAGPTLLDRLREMERRIEHLEASGATGLSGTDQTINGSHNRLDAILGAGNPGPVLEVAEQSVSPAAPGADKTKIYTKNSMGRSLLYLRDDYEESRIMLPQQWRHPGTPEQIDDEFDGDLTGWDIYTSNIAAYDCNTTWPSAVRVKIENGTASFQLSKMNDWPAGSIQNIAALFYAAIGWNDQCVRMGVWDMGWQNAIMVDVGQWSGALQWRLLSIDSGVTTVRAYINPLKLHTSGIVLVIETDDQNHWKGGFSWDGYAASLNATYTKVMSGAYVTLQVVHSNGPIHRLTYGIEWFRRNWCMLW